MKDYALFFRHNSAMVKKIKKRLEKFCAVCGQKMKIISYADRTYRGGHHFGRFPLCTKKAVNEVLKAGTKKETIFGMEIQVLKKDPKLYRYAEYWECPKCYWGKYPRGLFKR